MTEQHLQSKLIDMLKNDNIQLWKPPYTSDNNEAGQQPMQELSKRYFPVVGFKLGDVQVALEDIRSQAVKKGKGNQQFRETSIATLELVLPKEQRKDKRKKTYLETKLDVTAQDLMTRISSDYGLRYIKLIVNGKVLVPEKPLEEQAVRNNSKVMVLRLSEPEMKRMMQEEEERNRSHTESLQRTQKGFEILSERDGSEDPATTPFLEIADQRGNPLHIPPEEKKALTLAMVFHEKGRALMKRKDYDAALSHLLQADSQFSKCNSALLNSVDNHAVLQLDVVWCYRALEALSCLNDSKQRLTTAEGSFNTCYGQGHSRLQQIKGSTGGEQVLFLRLYLLQSLLAYYDGDGGRAKAKLAQVEELYGRLRLDPEKMRLLQDLGYSEQEARLGLRACHGDCDQAALHISQRRTERQELRELERVKRRRRVDGVNTLVELGYSKREASKALHDANGDVNQAYVMLMESAQAFEEANSSVFAQPDSDRQAKVDQLAYLGFQRDVVEAALRMVEDDVVQATQLLLENQGVLDTSLLSPSSPPSSSSEEPSTSSESAGSSSLDADLVNEVLEDIPRHEEDYLDLTLEEEGELISLLRSYLSHPGPSS